MKALVFAVGDRAWAHLGGKDNALREVEVVHAFDLWGRRHYVVALETHIDPLLEVRDGISLSDSPDQPIGLWRR